MVRISNKRKRRDYLDVHRQVCERKLGSCRFLKKLFLKNFLYKLNPARYSRAQLLIVNERLRNEHSGTVRASIFTRPRVIHTSSECGREIGNSLGLPHHLPRTDLASREGIFLEGSE